MENKDFYPAFNRSAGLLQKMASKLTDNMDDARLLYQETAYRASKYYNKMKPEDNFRRWATILMGNVFLSNTGRKNDRAIMKVSGQIRQEKQGTGAAAIIKLVEGLDERYRIPFWNHYMGMKPEEIAESTGLPEKVVRERIYLAQKQLKHQLNA